jgi:hypothetical protein
MGIIHSKTLGTRGVCNISAINVFHGNVVAMGLVGHAGLMIINPCHIRIRSISVRFLKAHIIFCMKVAWVVSCARNVQTCLHCNSSPTLYAGTLRGLFSNEKPNPS